MTQEDKHFLLVDLCARLPYEVKCREFKLDSQICTLTADLLDKDKVDNLEPYLRPMSSMTEEELKEYDKATDADVADSAETLKVNLEAKSRVRVSKWYHGNDWLNEHHFDYRDLISMGLALEAPEGMYNTHGKIELS